MTDKQQLNAEQLIVENIQVIEDSIVLFKLLEKKIFEQMFSSIEDWAQDQEYYFENDADKSDSHYAPSFWCCPESLCLAPLPSTTKKNTGRQSSLSIYFDWNVKARETDTSNLLGLLGQDNSHVGFSVYLSMERLNINKQTIPFKKLLTDFNTRHPELEKLGLKLDSYDNDLYWFLPFKLDKSTLLRCIENEDFEPAMEPVLNALSTIDKAVNEYFTKLVNEAQAQFGIAEENS